MSLWMSLGDGAANNHTAALHLVTLLNVTFYVGAVHHQWCLKNERQQVDLFQSVLSSTNKKDCLVVDVGMNDGFYTQMAAALGCRVYAFEIQPACVSLSEAALRKNGLLQLVNITQQPVSSAGGEHIEIRFPRGDICDGGFSLHGGSGRSHSKAAQTEPRNFTTVSLSTFPPLLPLLSELGGGPTIDILKIDAESHEKEILQGLLPLLAQRRVRIVIVELSLMHTYADPAGLRAVYRNITDMGYTLTTFNCNQKKRGQDDVWNSKSFEVFWNYAQWSPISVVRCPDIRIDFVGVV